MIMLTLALVPMFGIVGLVTDIGYMHFIKMSAQTAAQAAAGATIIDMHVTLGGAITSCGGAVVCSATPTACAANITTPTNSVQHGCMYAQAHGFNGANQVTYQSGIGSVPAAAPGTASASYWVTFRVAKTVPQMFSAILGNAAGVVVSSSTGAILGATDCIYALNPSASGSISVGGSASLTSSCGIFDNSSSASAITQSGAGTISAPEYDVVGNVSGTLSGPAVPNTGVSHITDPLAYLAAPASAPYVCAHTNYSVANNTNPTLFPGVYCGGIQGVAHNIFTFSPGTYILVGGGLSTGANSELDGNGVTFYNTFDATHPYAGISIWANSVVNLKAPNTGSYTGILFFEDRAATIGSGTPALTSAQLTDDYGGGGSAVYQGVIYAKNAAVTMHGNSSVSAKYTLLIADTINLIGNSGINNDYSMLTGGSPIQQTVLY
jgi:hypothetical protein